MPLKSEGCLKLMVVFRIPVLSPLIKLSVVSFCQVSLSAPIKILVCSMVARRSKFAEGKRDVFVVAFNSAQLKCL